MRRVARSRTALDRFLAARRGSTAVEFAMVAAPFFFMLFAVLELAFVFVLDSVLENAVIETGRLVRTGLAECEDFNADQFKTALWARMSIFASDCATRVTVDVREIPQFTNPNPPDPTAGETFSEAGLGYDHGDPGSLMLVRAWYRHSLFTPFLEQGLARMGDGKAILTATTAFRNEPWR